MRFPIIAILAICILSACTPKWEKLLQAEIVEAPVTQQEKDKNLILKYAIENKLQVQSTPEGVYYVIEIPGTGEASPNMQSIVSAHYEGTLLDSTVFDSSIERGKPLEFSLGGVIKGWQVAIPLLKKGGKGKFFIPSELAYGNRGAGKDIGPNTVLVFDIELLDFYSKEEMISRQKEKDKTLIDAYLEEKQLTAQSTESGLYYVIEKEGEGDHPTINDKVTVHYEGMLLDGTMFDSSVRRGKPISFALNGVVKGWQEGIPKLRKGGKGKLIIPSHLGYGSRGAGGKIPPNSVLVFDVELIDF